jgi:N-formylmaleamate deformylase
MSTFPNNTIHANGIALHYYRTGGNKPPIVLLHGFTDNALCWTHVAHVLAPDYDVIMVDARGHGLSEGPTTGFSTQLQADDITALIQALHLDHPFLLGHSMGAFTASLVSAQHPDLIRATLLEDPPWFTHTSSPPAQNRQNQLQEPSAHPWYKRVAELKAQTREERIKMGHRANPTWIDEELEPWADAKEQFDLNVFRYNSPFPSWRAIIPVITCPILLITGDTEKGALITPEVALEASHLWKDGQLIRIAGASHNIRRDQFAHYRDVITTFLRNH